MGLEWQVLIVVEQASSLLYYLGRRGQLESVRLTLLGIWKTTTASILSQISYLENRFLETVSTCAERFFMYDSLGDAVVASALPT